MSLFSPLCCRIALITALFFALNPNCSNAQTVTDEAIPTHKISLLVGNLHSAEISGLGTVGYIPFNAYSLNYDFLFHSGWSVGCHNDLMVLENESAKGSEETLVKYETSIASKLIWSYHPTRHIGLLFGVGDEIAPHENYLLSTVGADMGFEIYEGWELGTELCYDFKLGTANNWVVGIGISKILYKKHKRHS